MRNTLPRMVNLPKSQSFFLFGGRGTGKSTLLRQSFHSEECHWIDLLDSFKEAQYSRNPNDFRTEVLGLSHHIQICVVDEIQKQPKLLDEIHRLIETDRVKIKFALTGSSARKLKYGGANLLAGRAVLRSLFPFTPEELGPEFDLQKYLSWGGLPHVWSLNSEDEIRDYLRAYAQVYLKEEVWNEQIIRQLEPFRRFLEIAAQGSGKILNYRNVARDTGIDPKTVPNWYSILEDTLVGFHLDSFDTSTRKQLRKASKFYLFDVGVTRSLAGMLNYTPTPGTSSYGDLFEQFIVNQIYALSQYRRLDYKLSYLQTKAGVVIDLVIWRPGKSLLFIEIKSAHYVDDRDCKNLRSLYPDFKECDFVLLSRDPIRKQIGMVEAWFFSDFLRVFGS